MDAQNIVAFEGMAWENKVSAVEDVSSRNARTHICHALCLSLPQGECCRDHCDHHDDRDRRQYLRIESTATWDSIAVAEEEEVWL